MISVYRAGIYKSCDEPNRIQLTGQDSGWHSPNAMFGRANARKYVSLDLQLVISVVVRPRQTCMCLSWRCLVPASNSFVQYREC